MASAGEREVSSAGFKLSEDLCKASFGGERAEMGDRVATGEEPSVLCPLRLVGVAPPYLAA